MRICIYDWPRHGSYLFDFNCIATAPQAVAMPLSLLPFHSAAVQILLQLAGWLLAALTRVRVCENLCGRPPHAGPARIANCFARVVRMRASRSPSRVHKTNAPPPPALRDTRSGVRNIYLRLRAVAALAAATTAAAHN